MGLIDYLGRWNIQKKSEMLGKTFRAHFIRQNTDFSVKPPHEFANRFLKKVKKIFKIDNKNNSKKFNHFQQVIESMNNYDLGIEDEKQMEED